MNPHLRTREGRYFGVHLNYQIRAHVSIDHGRADGALHRSTRFQPTISFHGHRLQLVGHGSDVRRSTYVYPAHRPASTSQVRRPTYVEEQPRATILPTD